MIIADIESITMLDSIFEIEELLPYVQSLTDEVEHLKNLKKWRAKKIDEKISSHESKIEHIKRVILNTMSQKEPKKKTIGFPGVGKVTRKAKALGWQILDEDSLLVDLEKRGEKIKVIETKEVLSKKLLNNLLDELENKQDLPSGVSRTPSSETLSVTFEENCEPKELVSATSAKLDNLEELES